MRLVALSALSTVLVFAGELELHGELIFGPVAPVAELNSAYSDELGSISGDGLTIVLASRRGGAQEIYSATRSNLTSAFGTPSHYAFSLLMPEEGCPVISADGLTLFYTHGDYPYSVFTASRTNTSQAFTGATGVPIGYNTRPSWLSPDGLRLYYHALESGLWHEYVVSRPNTTSPFGAPSQDIFANLRLSGTADQEAALSADELQIFFVSDRPGGLGDDDIWWASRPNRLAAFGAPVNLSAVNTAESDRMPVVFGNTLFFASKRDHPGGNYNGLDIYQAPFSTSSPIPEPSSLTLFAGLGVMGLVGMWRRRSKRSS